MRRLSSERIAGELSDQDWSKVTKKWGAVLDYLLEHGIHEWSHAVAAICISELF